MSLDRRARVGVPAVLLVLLGLQAPAFAQKGGQGGAGGYPPGYDPNSKMPSREQIEKTAQEFMARSETRTAELEGFAKLTYKAIPCSTDEIGKLIGEQYKDKIPKGIDVDAAVRQFGPQIQEAFNTYLTEPEGWKFEALADLKLGSKTVKKGEYKISLQVEGEALRSIVLTQGEKDKKPTATIRINVAQDKKEAEPFARLKFDFKLFEKKGEKGTQFHLLAEFFRTSVKSKDPFKAAESKDAKKDEAKKEDKKDEGK